MGHDYEKLTKKAQALASDWRNREDGHRERENRVRVVTNNLAAVKKSLDKFDFRVHIMQTIFAQMPKQEARMIMDIMETPNLQEKTRAFKNGMELDRYQTFIAQAWRNFGYALEQVEGWEDL